MQNDAHQPNQYGVYSKTNAECIEVKNSRSYIKIYFLQLQDGWIAATSLEARSTEGFTSPLSKRFGLLKTKQQAFDHEMRRIKKYASLDNALILRIKEKFLQSTIKQMELF